MEEQGTGAAGAATALTGGSGLRWLEFEVDGVHVEGVVPVTADEAAAARPPIVCIHGGMHGSWCWHDFMGRFAQAGWRAYAFDWYHHHRSRRLPAAQFVRRSIADVGEEIGKVAAHVGGAPVIVGHSMGGLAAQAWAAQADAAALVLVTPVAPAAAGGSPLELPLPLTAGEPVAPPPFDMARAMFFEGVPEERARELHARLCPESPQAVLEATQFSLPVDTARVRAPVLALAGGNDFLAPPELVRRVAALYGGEYVCLAGKGHSLLLEPGWPATADLILAWLRRTLER